MRSFHSLETNHPLRVNSLHHDRFLTPEVINLGCRSSRVPADAGIATEILTNNLCAVYSRRAYRNWIEKQMGDVTRYRRGKEGAGFLTAISKKKKSTQNKNRPSRRENARQRYFSKLGRNKSALRAVYVQFFVASVSTFTRVQIKSIIRGKAFFPSFFFPQGNFFIAKLFLPKKKTCAAMTRYFHEFSRGRKQ